MPSRHIWPLYALLLSALAWVFFADVLTLGLDTHDVETFRDHERISEDFAYFFSPDKEQASGRAWTSNAHRRSPVSCDPAA